MRLETIFVLLAAVLGLFWFQRLCEELLWVRKHPFHGADLHSLFQDESQREAIYNLLAREGAFPGSNETLLQSSIGTQILAEQAARQRAVEDQTLGGSCKKLLWFMGLRAEDASQFEYYRYLQVAMLSARRNAPSLVPHLLFDGAPNEVTAWFDRHGGRVVLHELTLEDVMKKAVEQGHQPAEWFRNRGAFLRMDIPFIFPELLNKYADDPTVEKNYFLYTDNDVIFLKDIDSCSFTKPPLFTIGAEHEPGKAENTGIMFVNASAFSEHRNPLVEFAIARNWQFGAMDQGLILEYMATFNHTIPVLPDIYNWKGYWGGDDKVAIVHFHGPKPERCLPCLAAHPKDYWQACQIEQSCPDVYKMLFDKTVDRGMFFKRMLQTYHVLRYEAEHS